MELIKDNDGIKIYVYDNVKERDEHISKICDNKLIKIKIYGNNKDIPLTTEIEDVVKG